MPAGPCSVCRATTEWACSDCRINGDLVYVCTSTECRNRHEEIAKCTPGRTDRDPEACPRCGSVDDCPDPACGDTPDDPNAWRPRKFA